MITPTALDQRLAARWRAEGAWTGETLPGLLARRAAEGGRSVAVIDGDRTLSFAELDRAVAGCAGWLRGRGVGRGDVVSFMLPNWWEALVVQLATARLGGVVNPLHMIYRGAELRQVLTRTRPVVVVHPGTYRGTDHTALLEDVADCLGAGTTVLAARGADDPFAEVLAAAPVAADVPGPDAGDVLLLLFTSGTTSAPKGVLHTHDTLVRAAGDLAAVFDLAAEDRVFMPSPVTHVAGLLYALVMPALRGCSVVLQDRWDADAALDLVLTHGCTFTGGATPFIQGLVRSATARGLGPDDVPLRRASCGGAGVPPQVVHDADRVLGTRVSRIYGLTEGITVSASHPAADPSVRAGTDGEVLPGFRFRIADPAGADVAPGQVGELQVRGPATCVGYLDAADNTTAWTGDGLFRTGDLVRLHPSGAIQVEGRIKDIIIRAGENISAREIEELLDEHPRVLDVAVVGLPDPDVGERACAFVVLTDGPPLELSDLTDFLRSRRIAVQKLPERLVCLPALPRTGSGKVQKNVLRDRAGTKAVV